MESEESFYGQKVVCWSCLQIVMISIDFGRNKEEEKSYCIIRQYAGKEQREKGKNKLLRIRTVQATDSIWDS